MSAKYIEIVAPEDIEHANGVAEIDSKYAERYEPLRRIAYPWNNGHGDWTETVVLTYMDGSTERVRGHVVSDGVIDDG